MKLVLHSYWRSSASHRVRTGLHLKELAYEYVAVNLLEKRQHADEYRARNPMAQVPTLEITEDDGTVHTLTQSLPILEYAEERWPSSGTPLLPRDVYQRARTRMLAEIVNSGIQPHQNMTTLLRLKAAGADETASAREYIAKGLAAFEQLARETAGKFCVGDAPTLADCCLIPQLVGARRFGVELAQHELLLAIEQRCLALPAFAKAMPDQQPDAMRS